jgi:hypothetical protein
MATEVTAHGRRFRRVLTQAASHLTYATIAHVIVSLVQLALTRYLHQ